MYELSFGTVCGICAGVFLKKGAKALAFVFGGVFVLLQVCAHWPSRRFVSTQLNSIYPRAVLHLAVPPSRRLEPYVLTFRETVLFAPNRTRGCPSPTNCHFHMELVCQLPHSRLPTTCILPCRLCIGAPNWVEASLGLERWTVPVAGRVGRDKTTFVGTGIYENTNPLPLENP